jgi:uncharacterized membrane protein YjgN (DUF898 family)
LETLKNIKMEDIIQPNTFPLQVDNGNIPYLNEAAKWGKFLSILGFIVIGFLLIFGILAALAGDAFYSSAEFENLELPAGSASIIICIYFFIIALLYFFPCLYLYNFSSKMQTAIRHNDQISLNKSFQSLKSLLKFWGILTIIMLSIWVLAIIFGVALGTMFSAH